MSMLDFFTEEEFQAGRSKPEKVIIASAIIGILLVVVGIVLYLQISAQAGGAVLILGIIIMVLPYGLVSFLMDRAIRQMENQFPAFLKDLAESKRGGMTIIQAFERSKESDYGRLNSEIKKIHNQLTWGIPFPEVMARFSNRMDRSTVIQQYISILLQSFKSGGDITATIESIAEDSERLKDAIKDKNSQIKQQLFIMYVIYFMFIGITIGLYFLMSQLLGLGDPGGGALSSQQALFSDGESSTVRYCGSQISVSAPMCEIAKVFSFVPQNVTDFSSSYAQKLSYGNMAYFKSLLFSMLIVQGICTGAVAGQISSGSPVAGIKHVMIMLPVAVLAFMVVVGSAGF